MTIDFHKKKHYSLLQYCKKIINEILHTKLCKNDILLSIKEEKNEHKNIFHYSML